MRARHAKPRRWPQPLAIAAAALPMAEAGHALAYGLAVPGQGAHSYLPALTHLTGALSCAGLLVVLALVVLARLWAGPLARRPAWSFPLLFSCLLAAQLAIFLFQEGVEARQWPGLATVAVGLLAQQPGALLAGLALRWLSARLGPALESLATPRRPGLVLPRALPPAGRLVAAPAPRLATRRPSADRQRGPPA